MPLLRLLPPATVVDTPEAATRVLTYLMNRGGRLAIDTETTGLDVMRDRILYWSMATESERYFLEAKWLYAFDRLFANKDISWYLANAKYDMHMLANAGTALAGEIRDIIVSDARIDDTRNHGLKEQAHDRYEIRWGDFKDLFLDPDRVAASLNLNPDEFRHFKSLKGQAKLPFVYNANPKTVIDYASCDAYFTYMLGEANDAELGSTELPVTLVPGMNTLLDYYNVIEVPLTKSLFRMERKGTLVDLDYVKSVDAPMRTGLAEIRKDLNDMLGRDFNPGSNDDLGDVLFNYYKLKPLSYTKGGAPSVNEGDLERLVSRLDPGSSVHTVLTKVMKYAHLAKLHGTYVKNVHKHLGPDGRVHCKFNQTGARTSRLSSSNPNMQNIPARNDPYKLRGMFVAPEGYQLVDADYPQIEFRIAAVLANEEPMMEAFRNGWDIHTANAANTFGHSYEDIMATRAKKDRKEPLTPQDKILLRSRDDAKELGLSVLYGKGAFSLGAALGISTQEATAKIVQFFEKNPKIDELVTYMHDFAERNGFTYTMLGCIRRLHRITSGMSGIEAAERRQALNTLIQGSGAEMMKLAILRIDNDPVFEELGGELILTVHDELISEAPTHNAQLVLNRKCELMGDPYQYGPINLKYPIPIAPDGSYAKCWSEAK